MTEKMKIRITKAQYSALNDIRGLQQDAHYMVILAKEDPSGDYILEGTEKTFDGLVSDLYDEVEFEMQPKSKLKYLRQLICEIHPDGEF